MARSAHDISDATLRLLMVPGIGPATMRKLSERFGSHDEIVNASITALMQIPGIGRESAEALKRGMDAAAGGPRDGFTPSPRTCLSARRDATCYPPQGVLQCVTNADRAV